MKKYDFELIHALLDEMDLIANRIANICKNLEAKWHQD